MPVKIRLTRMGAVHRPFYRIVVANAKAPRDGKFIEKIGYYNPLLPKDHTNRFHIDVSRFKYWVSTGAIPTKVILRLTNNLKELVS
ncbi:30S ribosomal protein S16 [Candidatus Xenohaliotis californiensis]|uniref:Small ribosomal subunit protein bS16 n=1 Tax=Candidatus Xenohaliotis californiensis TaxID=84677 RepID=A0ABP0EVN6_9RICK|nr:30S ribosomal protein S16 [Candidatus Xenohaliotis californiensis]